MASNFNQTLAAVLTYPGEDYAARVGECIPAAPEACRTLLEKFAAEVLSLSAEEQQELFTRTFDLNPLCSLELGWHLFGENYDRGLLMSRMRQEMRRHGVDDGGELPDHLTHALLLLARMEPERAGDFAAAVLMPALQKMLGAFKDKKNPYEYVLQAAAKFVLEQYPESAVLAPAEPCLKVLDPVTAEFIMAGQAEGRARG